MPASRSRQDKRPRRGRPRVINERSDVRAAATALFAQQGYRATGVRDIAGALGIGPTSIYSHIKTKAELLYEIVIETLDALLDMQHDAITSTDDVVEQLRRAAEGQLRFLVEHRDEALIAIRDFLWAEGDALTAILERRRRYRAAFEDLLDQGVSRGRMAVANPRICGLRDHRDGRRRSQVVSPRRRHVDQPARLSLRRIRATDRGRIQRLGCAHRLTSTTRHSRHDRGKACWKSMYTVTRSETAACA